MRGVDASLPAAFSLLQSEFNDFLFAPIGEEGNGTILTVLSAFARSGVDPWQESARLGQLSTDLATERLTSIIAGLPNGRWAPSEVRSIVARLIDLLPARRVFVPSLRETVTVKRLPSLSWVMFVAIAVLAGLIVFTVASRDRPAAVGGADSSLSTVANAPPAPLAGSQ